MSIVQHVTGGRDRDAWGGHHGADAFVLWGEGRHRCQGPASGKGTSVAVAVTVVVAAAVVVVSSGVVSRANAA